MVRTWKYAIGCFAYLLLISIGIIFFLVCSGSKNMIQIQGHHAMPEGSILGFRGNMEASRYRSRRLLDTCTRRDISISQSRDSTTGIPEYMVQIVNTCISGCAPYDVHFHCAWFASAKMVNPKIFKRIAYDNCLVNDGKPLKPSQMLSFTYSNTFMYPLTFKSAKFC